nr:putative ribonuclease H-like domain-containing protein [Tanacetum cinerariifolium]
MNCDFLETKYYYATQHSSDGESECLDTLNWLRYVASGDGGCHSIADESHLSTQPEDHINVTQTAPNLIPKVSNPSPISNPIETNASWQGGMYRNKRWSLIKKILHYSLMNMCKSKRNPLHKKKHQRDIFCHQEQIGESRKKDIPQKRCLKEADTQWLT